MSLKDDLVTLAGVGCILSSISVGLFMLIFEEVIILSLTVNLRSDGNYTLSTCPNNVGIVLQEHFSDLYRLHVFRAWSVDQSASSPINKLCANSVYTKTFGPTLTDSKSS
jgi:hypothetical protein